MAPRHLIPSKVIAKIINEAGVADSPAHGREWSELHALSWDTIKRIIKNDRKEIEFSTADRILCALDMNELWYRELKQWYYPPGIDPPNSFRKACEAMGKLNKVNPS